MVAFNLAGGSVADSKSLTIVGQVSNIFLFAVVFITNSYAQHPAQTSQQPEGRLIAEPSQYGENYAITPDYVRREIFLFY